MVKFKALQSAIVTGSKVPHVTTDVSIEEGILNLIKDNKDITTALNRQDGGLDGGLEITIRSKVIETIRNNPKITQKELVAETAIPLRTIQRVMKELQEDGKIERKGGKRYGYWEVVDSVE